MSIDWIYQGRLLALGLKQKEDNHYEVVQHPGAVAMIPIASDGSLILIKQHRYAIDQILLELPAGCLEKGENPKDAAQRELREEIGYGANRLELITHFYPSPGYCNEKVFLFLAQDLFHAPLTAEDTDEITVVHMPYQVALKEVLKGTIVDAKTIMGILLYHQWRDHA